MATMQNVDSARQDVPNPGLELDISRDLAGSKVNCQEHILEKGNALKMDPNLTDERVTPAGWARVLRRELSQVRPLPVHVCDEGLVE